MGELTDRIKASFYKSDDFLSFYSAKYRLKQLKRALTDKRTSAGEALAIIKYLDAHVGDVPAKGPDSGELTIKYVGFDGASDNDPV